MPNAIDRIRVVNSTGFAVKTPKIIFFFIPIFPVHGIYYNITRSFGIG